MKALGLCLVLFSAWASAADVSVTLTAEKAQIQLEETLEVQVAIKGSRENQAPELLHTENFEVQPAGTSSQLQIINGSMSQQIVFTFVLSPKAAGKFRIGPARVTID